MSRRKKLTPRLRNATRCLLANASVTYAFARYLLSTSKQAKKITRGPPPTPHKTPAPSSETLVGKFAKER